MTSPRRILYFLTLVWSLLSAPLASAESATVVLQDGTRVSGELREYVHDDHVTLVLEDARVQTFPAASIAALELGGGAIVPPPAPAPAVLPAVEDPRITALRQRRYDVRVRRVSIALPIVLIAAGAGVSALGWGAVLPVARDTCYWDSYDATHAECKWTGGAVAGAAVGSVGMVAFVTGIALLPGRIAKRRARQREIDAIDLELRQLGAHLQVAPWLQGGAGSVAGLRAQLTF